MNDKKRTGLKKALIIALVVILIALLAWHLLLPVLGVAFALTAAVWGVIVATVVLFAVGTLLFFAFSGIGIVVVCILGFFWFIGAFVTFPFLFPLLLPLLVILLFVAFVRKKETG